MHQNSPTRVLIFKKFPGVIPRTPILRGPPPRGGRRGGEGVKGREGEGRAGGWKEGEERGGEGNVTQ